MLKEAKYIINCAIEATRDHLGTVTWFVVLIAAKIQFVTTKKKHTRGEYFAQLLYGIIGGMFTYLGTPTLRNEYRLIAVGIGVLAGDILISWIRTNTTVFLDLFGDVAKKYLRNKSK